MSVFFTADTHFGHEATLVAAKRSFVSVEALDGGLVDVWNAVVRSRDIGWHLGDFIDGRKVTADRCRKIFNASMARSTSSEATMINPMTEVPGRGRWRDAGVLLRILILICRLARS